MAAICACARACVGLGGWLPGWMAGCRAVGLAVGYSSLSVCLSACMTVCLPVCLSGCLSARPSVIPSACLSVFVHVHVCVRRSWLTVHLPDLCVWTHHGLARMHFELFVCELRAGDLGFGSKLRCLHSRAANNPKYKCTMDAQKHCPADAYGRPMVSSKRRTWNKRSFDHEGNAFQSDNDNSLMCTAPAATMSANNSSTMGPPTSAETTSESKPCTVHAGGAMGPDGVGGTDAAAGFSLHSRLRRCLSQC